MNERKIIWASEVILGITVCIQSMVVYTDQIHLSLHVFYRDVSGVELLMNGHQNLKAEIDTRDDNFTECFTMGKDMLARDHYASNDVSASFHSAILASQHASNRIMSLIYCYHLKAIIEVRPLLNLVWHVLKP